MRGHARREPAQPRVVLICEWPGQPHARVTPRPGGQLTHNFAKQWLALIRVRTPRQWLAKGVVRLPLRLAHSLAQLHNNNELAQLAAAQRDAAEG